MTPQALRALAAPDTLSFPVQALWHDAQGNWEKAHEVCQLAGSREGDWVHAYLHRKEGDLSNAAYWYSRAGRPAPAKSMSLEAEWEKLVGELS